MKKHCPEVQPLAERENMESWKRLEFEYASRLRESSAQERKHLYVEAYSAVSELASRRFSSDDPEERTAGTSRSLVRLLSQIVDKDDHVLEVGCGRGYTCLMISPFVATITGIEVSENSVMESRRVLADNKIKNVDIRQVSATEIVERFEKHAFTLSISIDVLEHLHPEDAREHLRQVFEILKPGGGYVIITPNRLNGPHDVTRTEIPQAKRAIGFHLNELTYRELVDTLRTIGFDRFRALYSLRIGRHSRPVALPFQFAIAAELVYAILPRCMRPSVLEKAISIRLIAHKPVSAN